MTAFSFILETLGPRLVDLRSCSSVPSVGSWEAFTQPDGRSSEDGQEITPQVSTRGTDDENEERHSINNIVMCEETI